MAAFHWDRLLFSVPITLLAFMANLAAATPSQHGDSLPHLDLELTSEEYRQLLKDLVTAESDDPLAAIIATGKRNLDWIAFINARRPEDRKLQLSNPALQSGIPIDSPSMSNRTIITTRWEEVKVAMPDGVKSVLIDNGSFTEDPPMGDEDFIVLLRKVDRSYQHASRWLLQEPYLQAYAERATSDVRGFYNLRKEPNLAHKLRNWSTLTDDTRTQLKTWLIGQCLNSDATRDECEQQFDSALQTDGHVHAFFELHQAAAKEHWDSFFTIPAYRTDVEWTPSEPNTMTVPFQTPERPEVLAWLRDNIEDEWKLSNWKLSLDFQNSTSPNMTHVLFVPGATPHVNRLAGSIITMDANRDINEYSSKWTIRHEYGHVLGFPDCYLEFYDEPAGVMVNYQLDIENLMCSRKGHLQNTHFQELKRAYYQGF